MKSEKLKLAHRLVMVVGALLAAVVGVGLFSVERADGAAERFSGVLEREVAQMQLATEALVDFKTQVQEWKNVLLRGKDAAQLDKYWAAFEQHEAQVRRKAQALQAVADAGEARALVARFLAAHAAMGEKYRAGLAAFKAAGADPAAGDLAVKGQDREPAELLTKIAELENRSLAAARGEAAALRQRTHAWVLGLLAVVLMLGACGAVLIARAVERQIGGEPAEAAAAARRIAQGDLAAPIPLRAGDTQSLFAALREMQQALATMVGEVRVSSDHIADGSSRIAAGNADLSQRAESQASSLQQTAASMDQMHGTVRHNADSARQAAQLAAQAREAAARGGEVVTQVVAMMDDITGSSRRIAEITGVIDGIAFQTNILALNAAVEAARAGEHGRGFAVVAGEVRGLAQRSAEAARQIKGLIGASVEKVDAGTQLAGTAGASMAEIVAQVKGVADLISEIDAATAEQTGGIGQVATAVSQLDRMTQQNAALVDQSAQAAASLQQQARQLGALVGQFQLAPGA